MGFFDLGNGKNAIEETKNGKADVGGGGNFEPIPDGTRVTAVLESIAWDSTDRGVDAGTQFVSVRWTVIAPEEYKNRKIFPKLWVSAAGKPSAKDAMKKRESDLIMLAAINANSPGQPLNALQGIPTDADLSKLIGTMALLELRVWELDDKSASGNWVSAIEGCSAQSATVARRAPSRSSQPAQPAQQQPQQQAPAAQPAQQQAPIVGGGMPEGMTNQEIDDEIPF